MNTTPILNPDLSNVNLPLDASVALTTTRDTYFAWLEIVDFKLWLATAICYQDFARDAVSIGQDDTIALFLDSAPMFRQFLAEQSGAARHAVMYPVRFVECES